jgi:hypothetical protein
LLALLFGCDNTDEQLEEQTSKQETEIRMPVILGDARYVGKECCVACHTMNGQILMTLSTINRDNGNIKESLFYAEKMLELVPDNLQIQEYIQTLKQKRNSG